MTKAEFMTAFINELKKYAVADADDIAAEYEQHFAFKLADGCSEEEIAAKLGDPADLAAQFAATDSVSASRGKKALIAVWLGFVELVSALIFAVLAAFALVLAVSAAAFAAAGVCLAVRLSPYGLIPAMPYASALIFAVALVALGVLTACGTVWYAAFLRQTVRAFLRFRSNTLARADGRAALPAVPLLPQLSASAARKLRKAVLIALPVFAAALIVGLVVSMMLSGSLAFWHAWGWFGYAG